MKREWLVTSLMRNFRGTVEAFYAILCMLVVTLRMRSHLWQGCTIVIKQKEYSLVKADFSPKALYHSPASHSYNTNGTVISSNTPIFVLTDIALSFYPLLSALRSLSLHPTTGFFQLPWFHPLPCPLPDF